ncbi:hypothetical protein O9929_27295 [Vibrio lentus]|nr:hypothetical protein [Vibrio lentus]
MGSSLFIGRRTESSHRFLKEFSIPEPVSGRDLASLFFAALCATAPSIRGFSLICLLCCIIGLLTSLPPFGINSV